MSKLVFAAMFAIGAPVLATAQSTPTLITAAPAPQPGAFCYYGGLAYSESALLTVDVPYRRESPEATQKELMTCTRTKDGAGLVWVATDLERPSNITRIGE